MFSIISDFFTTISCDCTKLEIKKREITTTKNMTIRSNPNNKQQLEIRYMSSTPSKNDGQNNDQMPQKTEGQATGEPVKEKPKATKPALPSLESTMNQIRTKRNG